MYTKIQKLSISILNSNYKFLFFLLIYFLIYSCFYFDTLFAFCMITNTVPVSTAKQLVIEQQHQIVEGESLNSYVSKLQRENDLLQAQLQSATKENKNLSKLLESSPKQEETKTPTHILSSERTPVRAEGKIVSAKAIAYSEKEKQRISIELCGDYIQNNTRETPLVIVNRIREAGALTEQAQLAVIHNIMIENHIMHEFPAAICRNKAKGTLQVLKQLGLI